MTVIPPGSLVSANLMSLASLPAPESLAEEKEASVASVLGSLTMGHPVLSGCSSFVSSSPQL